MPGGVGGSVVDEDVGVALPPQRPRAPVRQPRRLVQQHLAGRQTNLDIMEIELRFHKLSPLAEKLPNQLAGGDLVRLAPVVEDVEEPGLLQVPALKEEAVMIIISIRGNWRSLSGPRTIITDGDVTSPSQPLRGIESIDTHLSSSLSANCAPSYFT